MNNAELKVNQIEMAISREQTLANKNRRRNFASVLNSNARDIPFLLWKWSFFVCLFVCFFAIKRSI